MDAKPPYILAHSSRSQTTLCRDVTCLVGSRRVRSILSSGSARRDRDVFLRRRRSLLFRKTPNSGSAQTPQSLGGIECVRGRLLLPMIAVSVRLSRGSTWLHCAKTAERIKVRLGANTQGVLIAHSERRGIGGTFCPLWTL